ncbi:MAG: hypothetical protein HY036_00965 [Nitrospirae bacterium]|nr:hypothetical protein [Nitrospirota bacterium]
MTTIRAIREKIIKGEYEFTIPHFFEEMADDDLSFVDIQNAILKGRSIGNLQKIQGKPATKLWVKLWMEERFQLFVESKTRESYY